jgi:hypothetical protein
MQVNLAKGFEMETADWQVTELGEATAVVKASEPVADYCRVAELERWLVQNVGADGAHFLNDDDDTGNLVIVVHGVRLDDAQANIVPAVRDYDVTATVTVTFDVSLTVQAASQEEAEEVASDMLCGVHYANIDGDGWESYYSGYGSHDFELIDVCEQ